MLLIIFLISCHLIFKLGTSEKLGSNQGTLTEGEGLVQLTSSLR
jgi:hypothetical protein